VLATFENKGTGAPFSDTFTVPENAKAGNYVVIFSQSAPDGKASQAPVRALLTVTGTGGANPVLGAPIAPVDAARPAGLVTEDTSVTSPAGGAASTGAIGAPSTGDGQQGPYRRLGGLAVGGALAEDHDVVARLGVLGNGEGA